MSWMKKRTNVLVFSTPERMFEYGIFSFYRSRTNVCVLPIQNKCLNFWKMDCLVKLLEQRIIERLFERNRDKIFLKISKKHLTIYKNDVIIYSSQGNKTIFKKLKIDYWQVK